MGCRYGGSAGGKKRELRSCAEDGTNGEKKLHVGSAMPKWLLLLSVGFARGRALCVGSRRHLFGPLRKLSCRKGTRNELRGPWKTGEKRRLERRRAV